MGKILCRILGHHRSASRASRTADGWQSYCASCEVRMIRVAPGDWRVCDDDEQPAEGRFTEQALFRPTGTALRLKSKAPPRKKTGRRLLEPAK